jgi:hypothetical protein
MKSPENLVHEVRFNTSRDISRCWLLTVASGLQRGHLKAWLKRGVNLGGF